MIKVSAPGKLFLSGEWAVLEVGNPGIVAAVNKRVWVEVDSSDKISISVDDFNIKDVIANWDGNELKWIGELTDREKEKLIFIKGAIETSLQYLGEFKPFRIRSWGEESQIRIEDQVKKVGFGSSASCVVASVAGLLAFNGIDIEKNLDVIYKLSAIAHYFAQGKVGSAFDIAASTYGGVFVYKRFDPNWLMNKLDSGMSIKELVEQEWPGFEVEKLEIPSDLILLIGWTKESASTSVMIKQLNDWARTNSEEYKRLYDQIANLVRELIHAWKSMDKGKILELLRKNEDFLRELGEKSGVNIETPDLKTLSEIANRAGGAGKLSGAGGGDCGIAICFDKDVAEKIKKSWEQEGLYLIDATIDWNGVRKSITN